MSNENEVLDLCSSSDEEDEKEEVASELLRRGTSNDNAIVLDEEDDQSSSVPQGQHSAPTYQRRHSAPAPERRERQPELQPQKQEVLDVDSVSNVEANRPATINQRRQSDPAPQREQSASIDEESALPRSDEEEDEKEEQLNGLANRGTNNDNAICVDSSDHEEEGQSSSVPHRRESSPAVQRRHSAPAPERRKPVPQPPKQEVIEDGDSSNVTEANRRRAQAPSFPVAERPRSEVAQRRQSAPDSERRQAVETQDEVVNLLDDDEPTQKQSVAPRPSSFPVAQRPQPNVAQKRQSEGDSHQREAAPPKDEEPAKKQSGASSDDESSDVSSSGDSSDDERDKLLRRLGHANASIVLSSKPKVSEQAVAKMSTVKAPERQLDGRPANDRSDVEKQQRSSLPRPQSHTIVRQGEKTSNMTRKRPFPGRAGMPKSSSLGMRLSEGSTKESETNCKPSPLQNEQKRGTTIGAKVVGRGQPTNTSLKSERSPNITAPQHRRQNSDSISDEELMASGPVFQKRPMSDILGDALAAAVPRKSPQKQSNVSVRPRIHSTVKESKSPESARKRPSMHGDINKSPPNTNVPMKSTHQLQQQQQTRPVHGGMKKSSPSALKSGKDVHRLEQRQPKEQQKRHVPAAQRRLKLFTSSGSTMQSQSPPSKHVSTSRGSQLEQRSKQAKDSLSSHSPSKNHVSAVLGSKFEKSKQPCKVRDRSFGAPARSRRKAGAPPPEEKNLVALGRSKNVKKSNFVNARIRQAAKAKSGPFMSPEKAQHSNREVKSILKGGSFVDHGIKQAKPNASRNSATTAATEKRSSGALTILNEKVSANASIFGEKQVESKASARNSATNKEVDKKPSDRIAPTTSNERPTVDTSLVVEEPRRPSPYPPQDETEVKPTETAIPCQTVGIPRDGRMSASSGSVVSPTEELSECDDECIEIVQNDEARQESSDIEEEPNDEDDGADVVRESKSGTEETELPSPKPKRTLDSMNSPMVDSQASSQFAASCSSESEMTEQEDEDVVVEDANMLRDGLTSGEGLNLWTRSTRKKVNYSESRHDHRLSDSETYLDDDSPPKKRRKGEAANVDKTNESDTQDSIALRRPKRTRESTSSAGSEVSLGSRASTPSLDDDDVYDTDLKESLPAIDHLSVYTHDNDGLPTHDFSVLSSDGTIYDLRIQVKQSEIPGSGMGAFLTFRGARVLNDVARKEAAKMRQDLVFYETETRKELNAVTPGGYGVSIKLTGKNLHGNHNRLYWRPADVPTFETEEAGDASQEMASDSEDEDARLIDGPFGTHSEDDYVSDPTKELSTTSFSIELGRYGPILKTDRKREPDYDLKNFLFGDAPAEYGMGVDEKIGGCKQVIDLTDDITGTRHEAVLRLPMSYINEVGHSPNLKANVHIREKDDRSVFYFLKLVKSMKKGETVELLANYDDSYESIRERKGYGKENIENGMKSDEHEPTALERNFEDRIQMQESIVDLNVVDLFHLTEFAFENVLVPLDAFIEKYLNDDSSFVKPSSLQWVARHRLSWVADLILDRSVRLLQKTDPGFSRNLLLQVKEWGKAMKWNQYGRSVEFLAERDAEACAALKSSSREEILYRMSKKIVKPLNESMWCEVSVALIKSMCDDVATSLLLEEGERERFLSQEFFAGALAAMEMIQTACQSDDFLPLTFVSNVAKDEIVSEATVKDFDGFKNESVFFAKHTMLRKGIVACMLELQNYLDALELGMLPESTDVKIVSQEATHKVVMTGGSNSASGATVLGYPRRIDSTTKRTWQMNEEWYLLWQVVFVVHCFAQEFIGKSESGEYSLEKLCSSLGVDLSKAQAVVKKGIDTNEYEVSFEGKSKPKKSKKKPATSGKGKHHQRAPRRAVQGQTGASINKRLFDRVIWKTLVELGWTLDVGNRPRDFYYLPPGVSRGRGFSNRKDFFDSVKLVVAFIKTDSRWKDRPEVVQSLARFAELDELRARNTKKFDWSLVE